MKIEYNGAWPNLCSGQLTVVLEDGNRWEFPAYCMSSGGGVWFDDDWTDHVDSGEWSINSWPEGFPKDRMSDVIEAVNSEVPHGCCGGCV